MEDGTLLDFREGDQAFKFRIGEEINEWEKAVAIMKLGEKADLIIKSDIAYCKNDRPLTVPPDSFLTFTIDLLSI